jgi:hypothetical protein
MSIQDESLINMKQRLEFQVQGSAPLPYTVSFERVGDDLKTTCTCPAGQKGMYCKHRLSIIRGEFGTVVSANKDDLTLIPQLLKGSDVAAALENLEQVSQTPTLLSLKYALKPQRRRNTIDENTANHILAGGGFMKGNGGVNYFDLYDNHDQYCGSLKTRFSVFHEDLTSRLSRGDVLAVVRTDRQLHPTSQGVYAFLEGSLFAKSLTDDNRLKMAKMRLKISMR